MYLSYNLTFNSLTLYIPQVQSIKEARKLYANGNPMPFNVNNVDVTVSANAVSGLTSALLSGLVDKNILDDPEIAVRFCKSKI